MNSSRPSRDRVALVLSVLEDSSKMPVQEGPKLVRLKQLLLAMLDTSGNGIVKCQVRTEGEVGWGLLRVRQLLLPGMECRHIRALSIGRCGMVRDGFTMGFNMGK